MHSDGESLWDDVTSMTMTKQRFAIKVATRKVSVIRPANAGVDAWCEACAASVPMFLPERLAALAGVTPREIYRRVEEGELHFIETDGGELLICSSSVPAIRKHCSEIQT